MSSEAAATCCNELQVYVDQQLMGRRSCIQPHTCAMHSLAAQHVGRPAGPAEKRHASCPTSGIHSAVLSTAVHTPEFANEHKVSPSDCNVCSHRIVTSTPAMGPPAGLLLSVVQSWTASYPPSWRSLMHHAGPRCMTSYAGEAR